MVTFRETKGARGHFKDCSLAIASKKCQDHGQQRYALGGNGVIKVEATERFSEREYDTHDLLKTIKRS